MNKSTIINLIKFIGSKNPKYQIKTNKKGLHQIPGEEYWRDENYEKHGMWTQYYDDNTTYIKGRYVNGKKEGIFLEYALETMTDYENGDTSEDKQFFVMVKMSYKNNLPHGLWTYYIDRNKIGTKVTYVNGLTHGPYISKSYNGYVIEKGNYVNGKKEGKWFEYYEETGYPKAEGNYVADLENGEWIHYWKDQKGKVMSKEYFGEGGSTIEKIDYDKKGKVRKRWKIPQ